MKKDIHPKMETTIFSCACGETYSINSTSGGTVKIDICSKCHPLFSGKEKVIDSEGRIDRFHKKYKKAKTA